MDKDNKLFAGGKIMQYNLYEMFSQYGDLVEKMQKFVEAKQHMGQNVTTPPPMHPV